MLVIPTLEFTLNRTIPDILLGQDQSFISDSIEKAMMNFCDLSKVFLFPVTCDQ